MKGKQGKKSPTWVAVSGGFDPLHIGHIRLMQEAKKLGDKLVVIVNNDNWLRLKKGFVFMPQKERVELLRTLPFVDKVVLTDHKPNDKDLSVVRTLAKIKPAIFGNGGDRDTKDAKNKSSSLNADQLYCKEHGIKMAFNLGKGGKVQSSSWLIRDAIKGILRSVRPWGEFYGWNQGPGWYLKTLHIKAGKRLSLQYHHKRSECWVLVQGDAKATLRNESGTDERYALNVGELFIVPLGAVHRLQSKRGGVIVEIAQGEFDENDIVRLQDDHGRIAR